MKPLGGAIEVPEIKKPNFKNYYDFSFQRSVEKNLELTFGFREPLIRVYNQYRWDFYKKIPHALIGNNNWFFPNWHLDTPKYSQNLTDRFDREALYIYQLSNILKEYNTQLLICFVPSKIEIYREYITKDLGDYGSFNPIDYFCSKFDESGVNYINFTPMLYAIKDTATFKPYSQTGAHWSAISSVYAADSIFKRFSTLSNINMPELKIGKPYIDNARGQDNDLEVLYNLYRTIPNQINHYADVDIVVDSTTIYPKMITLGDSHFGNIVDNVPLNDIFSEHPYWYYANTIYFDKRHEYVSQLDIADELISADYFLLLYNAHQIYNMHINTLLKGMVSLCFDKEEIGNVVEKIGYNIKTDSTWVSKLEQKSIRESKSFDEVLYEEGTYLLYQNPHKYFPQLNTSDVPTDRNKDNAVIYNKYYAADGSRKATVFSEEERITQIMRKMRTSEEWMESLKKKAKTKNKTLEEVMREDAIWVIQEEKKEKEN